MTMPKKRLSSGMALDSAQHDHLDHHSVARRTMSLLPGEARARSRSAANVEAGILALPDKDQEEGRTERTESGSVWSRAKESEEEIAPFGRKRLKKARPW